MIRVLVKAFSPVLRAGLETILREDGRLIVIGGSGPMNGYMSAAADVLLMEDAIGAKVSSRAGLDHFAGPPVVLLADHLSRAELRQALYSGVRAVLPRDASGAEIIAAVEGVAAGLTVLSSDEMDVLLPASSEPGAVDVAPGEPLSARETEVLAMLAEGLANKEIAARLDITEHTVKFHVSSILGKLGVTSRGEAVARGIREGLIII